MSGELLESAWFYRRANESLFVETRIRRRTELFLLFSKKKKEVAIFLHPLSAVLRLISYVCLSNL